MAQQLQPRQLSLAGLTLLLGLLSSFAPFATDMFLAGLPAMAADLNTDAGSIPLTLSVFFLGMGLGQLFYGPLIDRFGRRGPLLAGVALYTLASLCLILLSSFPLFITLRFVQALGGCAGMIISRAVVQDSFPVSEAARVFTLMMGVQALGPVVAPVLGGYILEWSNWRVVFVFLCLLGLFCFLAVLLRLPETLPKDKRVRRPLPEIFRLFAHLLRGRAFLLPTLAGSIGGAVIFAFISGSPFVFMGLYGLDEVHYGWTFGIFALGMAVLSQLNRPLLQRASPAAILRGALFWVAVFSAALILLSIRDLPPLPLFMMLLFLALAPIPMILANSTALAMSVDPANAGSASSLVGAIQFGFAGIVSSLVGILHNGSVFPMVGVILASALLALAVMFAGKR